MSSGSGGGGEMIMNVFDVMEIIVNNKSVLKTGGHTYIGIGTLVSSRTFERDILVAALVHDKRADCRDPTDTNGRRTDGMK